MNYEFQETYEYNPEFEGEMHEMQEMHENELTQELLEIQNEEEFEYFLGNLVKSAWRGAKTLYNSPLGQKLKNQAVAGLKSMGRQALPGLGRTLGGHFLGPQGAQLGGHIGNFAAQKLGLEYEGGNTQERRYDAARRFVRAARVAARRIMLYARSGRPLNQRVVRNIILHTGRRWFPGLPAPRSNGATYGGGSDGGFSNNAQNRGTWVRQGNRIVLRGV